jgi:23S rRNA (uracil1939-C5)-methyltransferase
MIKLIYAGDEMIEKNKEYNIEILRQGIDGEGIGQIEGKTVFIEGALPGENVLSRIILVKKTYAVGKLMEVIKSSEERAQPVCPIYKSCGGCSIMHESYTSQLNFKEKKVYDNLERIGALNLDNIKCNNIIGMKEPFRYRNKVIVPVREEKGQVKMGFFSKKSHSIAEFETCFIQFTEADEILCIVRNWIDVNGIRAYNEEKHSGEIRDIMIRKGFVTGEIMVVIIALKENISGLNLLKEKLLKIRGIKSIILNINNKRTNVALGDKSVLLWGQDYIIDKISDLKFKIGANSFFQINPAGTEILYKKALEFADIKEGDKVIDAYCGAGTISLFVASKAKKVTGVEIVPEAIENAKENADLNKITNADFICGKSEEIIPELVDKGDKIDIVVVDPPRKGCERVLLEAIAKAEIKRMVYVSCDSATLARDLNILDGLGYQVLEVQPVDMFPETGHVECCCLLNKTK